MSCFNYAPFDTVEMTQKELIPNMAFGPLLDLASVWRVYPSVLNMKHFRNTLSSSNNAI